MTVTVMSVALNDRIAGTSDTTTDTLYTASGGLVQIAQASAYNGHTSPVAVSVYILASGQSASSVDPVCVETITNAEASSLGCLIGQVIPEGGSVQAFAGTTNVIRMSVSGIEYS